MGFALLDRDLRLVLVSAATAEVLATPPGTVAGSRLSDLDPLLAADLEPRIREILETGQALPGRAPATETLGGVRSAVTHLVPVHDSSGAVAGVAAVWWQTTEQGEPDQALEAERQARADSERVAERLARLQTVTAAFARALTIEEVYATVVEQAVSAAGADAGVVCLFHPGSGVIELARAVGYRPEHTELFQRFSVDDDLPLAEAVRTGRPVFVDSILEQVRGYEVFRTLAAASGRKAAAALPMMVEDHCIGALGLSFDTYQEFDAPQRAFLGAVVAQAGAALHRTRLWEAERDARTKLERAHERLVFLAQATAVTASTLDRAEILRRACRLAVPRIADFAVAYLQEGGELRRVALAHADPHRDRTLHDLVNRWPYGLHADVPAARCLRSQAVLRFSSVGAGQLAGAPAPVRDAIEDLGLGPSLYVPIVAREQAFGVLALAYDATRQDDYTEDDVTVATELTSRIASSLDNASLYAREHAVAVQLQRAVLPQHLPREEGLEIAARYLPSSSGVLVGGDWYDAFRLRDGRLGLAVGDVAGHGVLAAATMGQLRNALRAYATEGEAPGTVLERLSQLVAADGDAVFATATYGIYDPQERHIRWANAGHVPALLLSRQGLRFLSEPVDPILGVDPQRVYGTGEATLEPGDVVLWYTDGLVERRGEDLGSGLRRLQAALVGAEAAAVEDICDGVLRAMVGGRSHGDDICLLAIRPSQPRA